MDRPTCRLCLSWDVWCKPLPIFSSGQKEFGNLPQIIYDCSGIKVSADDGGPGVICHRCLGNITLFNEFREKCRKNNEFLMKFGNMAPEKNTLQTASSGDVNAKGVAGKTVRTPTHRLKESKHATKSCTHCCLSFKTLSAWLTHIKCHNKGSSKAGPKSRANLSEADRASFVSYTDVRKHRCLLCTHSFQSENSLKYHRNQHKTEVVITCEHCHKAFFKAGDIARHLDLVHRPPDETNDIVKANESHGLLQEICSQPDNKCNDSESSFRYPRSSQIHHYTDDFPLPKMNKKGVKKPVPTVSKCDTRAQCRLSLYTDVRPIQCPLCSHTFHRRKQRSDHVYVHKKFSSKTLTCVVCKKAFFSTLSLAKHFQYVHPRELDANYALTPEQLMKEPNLIKVCSVECYSTKQLLDSNRVGAHLPDNVVTDKSINILTTKSESNNGETVFSTVESDSYSSELQVNHNANSVKMHSVNDILYTQTNTQMSKNHSVISATKTNSVTTFQCHICKKILKRTSKSIHMQRHIGIKKFKCSRCGAGFSTSSDRGYHMKKCKVNSIAENVADAASPKRQETLLQMNQEVPERILFTCHICNKKYVSERFLNDHIIISHTQTNS